MNGCVLYMPLRAMHAPIVSPVMESVFYDVRDWRVFVSYSPCVSHQMMVNGFKNVQEPQCCINTHTHTHTVCTDVCAYSLVTTVLMSSQWIQRRDSYRSGKH